MALDELIKVSRRYGSDKRYVIAGGGNTSWKNDEFMYVKGSGSGLATIDADGFVKVELAKLDAIWDKSYSDDTDKREEEVLIDLMASRYPSEEGKRPSVETLLHALLPYAYVIHTHPALVNGMTCAVGGEKTVKELFGDKALWIPVTNPGYILAKVVRDGIEVHTGAGKPFPQMIFLQNHGVFVSGATIEEIDGIYADMFKAIEGKVKRYPVDGAAELDSILVEEASAIIGRTLGDGFTVRGFSNGDILAMAGSEEAFKPLSLSFTPDHIVYYGFKPLYVSSMDKLEDGIKSFVAETGVNPRLAVVKDKGAFSFNTNGSMAEKGEWLFLDDVQIAVLTESFGGYLFMPEDKIDFIRNWEAEKYRASK